MSSATIVRAAILLVSCAFLLCVGLAVIVRMKVGRTGRATAAGVLIIALAVSPFWLDAVISVLNRETGPQAVFIDPPWYVVWFPAMLALVLWITIEKFRKFARRRESINPRGSSPES